MNIPKKLYYVWIGDKEKPEIFHQCYKSWKEKMPDYEIVEINEKNFDMEYHLEKNRFFRECYDRKLWAYLGDYIRINYLYEHGGIYIDIDMEVVKDFTPVLEEFKDKDVDFFSFFESDDGIGISIHAAKKGSKTLKNLIDFYDEKIWKTPVFTQPAVIKWIFEKDYNYDFTKSRIEDEKRGVFILEKEHFFPFLPNEKWDKSMLIEKNYGIHWWFHSWKGHKPFLFLKTKHLKGIKKYIKKAGIYFQMFRDFLRNKK